MFSLQKNFFMNSSIQQLENIISTYISLLEKLTEENASPKPLPDKWSRKELVGHMVDSAQNNIRRFIVAQYETNPAISYAQDHWVAAADYQHYPIQDLIQLWILLNRHLVRVLKNIPVDMYSNEVLTGSRHSIEWLAADYNKHLLHHLHQVLNLKEVAYP